MKMRPPMPRYFWFAWISITGYFVPTY
jgi:hypothetical protein